MSEDKSEGKTRHDRDHMWAEEVTLKPTARSEPFYSICPKYASFCKFSWNLLPWDFHLFSLICDGGKFSLRLFSGYVYMELFSNDI